MPESTIVRPEGCICIVFRDTGGVRVGDLTCPVHGVGASEPLDGHWETAKVPAAGPSAPPGTYAQGDRSPIAYVHLCPPCGGYEPFTPEEYWGAISGVCQGCGGKSRELHRFPAVIDSARECACETAHQRVTGDLEPDAYGARIRAAFRELSRAHHPDSDPTPFCVECGFCWPCPTRRILDKAEGIDSEEKVEQADGS